MEGSPLGYLKAAGLFIVVVLSGMAALEAANVIAVTGGASGYAKAAGLLVFLSLTAVAALAAADALTIDGGAAGFLKAAGVVVVLAVVGSVTLQSPDLLTVESSAQRAPGPTPVPVGAVDRQNATVAQPGLTPQPTQAGTPTPIRMVWSGTAVPADQPPPRPQLPSGPPFTLPAPPPVGTQLSIEEPSPTPAASPRPSNTPLPAPAATVGAAGGDTRPAPTATVRPATVIVEADGLKARVEPNTSSAIVASFRKGDVVEVFGEVTGEAVLPGNALWYRTKSGYYIYGGAVSPVGE